MITNKKKVAGGVIAAVRKIFEKDKVEPLLKLGSISVIKRIVLTFQRAGIYPIVVVTGYESYEIERDLASFGVIFLKNENYETSQMFDYAKIGLDYLKDKCDQVIFNPANIPMFTPETIERMLNYNEMIVSPSYNGKSGHPILIASEIIPEILQYDGDMGMRGAIQQIGIERKWVDVEDEGILNNTDDIHRLDNLLEKHNNDIMHSFIKISIEKEDLFFDSRTKLLLLLIQDTHSVRNACKQMALSYSKAWNMINYMEKELGYEVVERKHGGKNGGKTYLTKEGAEFLEKYEVFEENIRQFAKVEFDRLFGKY
ncbi:NTP transferase domain-containing protein [uncultured Clostridium sp.]|uniref:NTP transferase domain-containing protein n=1 Tax=uncultured Clostridium sp. TaxID=59620 RepID=UPI0025840C11|nr:NTP transferase domain-containing protein [uncultured Clostridium sp.]